MALDWVLAHVLHSDWAVIYVEFIPIHRQRWLAVESFDKSILRLFFEVMCYWQRFPSRYLLYLLGFPAIGWRFMQGSRKKNWAIFLLKALSSELIGIFRGNLNQCVFLSLAAPAFINYPKKRVILCHCNLFVSTQVSVNEWRDYYQ